MESKLFSSKYKKPVVIGALVLVTALISIILSSVLLYGRTVDLLTENLRERLLTISITAAATIDANDLMVLREESDWRRPEWSSVVNKLHRAKYSNEDIVFMYIFRKLNDDPTQMEFIADADSINPYANTDDNPNNNIDVNRDGVFEPEGADWLQWPGQPYPEAVDIPEAFAAYNGPLVSADLYTDEYGTVLTGYAPIYDDNGEVAAILATDINTDDFFIITTQTLLPFIIFILVLTIIITFLIVFNIVSSTKYSESLERITDNLRNANMRLKYLDKQKSEFVSIASHQLRSPLTSIRGYASMLAEGTFGQLPEKAIDPVDRISESARMMAIAVEDYLNVSRIESGNMQYAYSEFSVVDEIEKVADDKRPAAIKKGLGLLFRNNLNSAGIVNADIGKVVQIAHNLINNALKYTPEGSISVILRDDLELKKVYVDVVDTGIGMSQETIERVFEKFERAENANSVNVSGTGLGLYVALKMAEAMQGHISAVSKGDGEGSIFTLELPLLR